MPESFYYILISIVLLSIILAWLKSETLANPVTIYNLWWGGFIFLSSFNLIGMRMPSMRTYSLLFLNLGMFSIGGIIFLGNNYLKYPKISNRTKNIKINLYFQFQLIITVILLFVNYRTFKLLKTLDPGTLRGMIYSSEGMFGSYGLYFAYFIKPFIFGSMFIAISGMLLGKLPKKYYFISFFNLILLSLCTVGRLPIFLAIISTLLGLVFVSPISKFKIKFKYILISIIPIILIVSVSIFRKSGMSNDVYSILKNYFVWYFTGPFTAFDYFLEIYKPGIDYDFSIYRSFFAGIEEFFGPILMRVFPGFIKTNYSIHQITAPFRSLGGKGTFHNSHFTMLFTFYRDGGEIGIVIYSFILGMINSVLFNTFRRTYSIVSFALLLIVFYVCIMGLFKWEIRYIWSVGAIIVILFFAQTYKIVKNKIQPKNA